MKQQTLKLKSSPTNIHKLEKFVERICDEYNINNTYFGNILVSLTEAFENACIHGNLNDPEKTVVIVFSSVQKGLQFEVKNEGQGFDHTNIPDATDVEGNPEKKGTGIFLIKSLTDEVSFKDNGKCIKLQFFISSINQQMADERINQLTAFRKVEKQQKIKNE